MAQCAESYYLFIFYRSKYRKALLLFYGKPFLPHGECVWLLVPYGCCKLIKKNKIEKPFFLSGGIGLDDVAKIKAFKHPDFIGIDINSKFEKEPGVKDMALVLQLKQAMK